MASNITYQVLTDNQEEICCSTLKLDEFVILLDCGWTESYNLKDRHIQELQKLAKDINLIILSHADLAHVGALPYLVGKLGCKAKIYATTPVSKMGAMLMYDQFQIQYAVKEFDVFNLDDVDAAFEAIKDFKYSQRIKVDDAKGAGITLVPFNAGHTVGGSIWKISKETDEILYAVDFNHKKERLLNGMESVLGTLAKPSILIVDAYTQLRKDKEVKQHEKHLCEQVSKALVAQGNVLIPCDTSTRCFEMLYALDHYWKHQKGFANYGLVFLSNMSFRTMEFAQSQLEWMSETVKKAYDERRDNQLKFKFVKLCSSIQELKSVPQPMCVLATSECMDAGFAHDLFVRWSNKPNNLILLTQKTGKGTLARTLYDAVHNAQPVPNKFKLQRRYRVQLQGEELIKFEQQLKAQKEAEKKKKKEEEQRKNMIQIRDEEDSDEEQEPSEVTTEAPSHYRLFLPENLRYHSQHLMFPCIEPHYEFDEYGIKFDVEKLKNKALQMYESEQSGNGMDMDEIVVPKMEEEKQQDVPTKVISQDVDVFVSCRVDFVDMEGRSSGQTYRYVIQQLLPRQVILTHGSQESLESLFSYCESKKIADKIQVATSLEVLDVSTDTKVFKVKLKEDLLKELSFVKHGLFELAFLEGEYKYDQAEEASKTSTTKLASVYATKSKKGHASLFIGDVKMSQFRELLEKNGFSTEFQSGCLIVNGSLLLRRDAQNGQILIEGSFSVDYFKVRSLLYSQFTIV